MSFKVIPLNPTCVYCGSNRLEPISDMILDEGVRCICDKCNGIEHYHLEKYEEINSDE